jgi:hypothetical protein
MAISLLTLFLLLAKIEKDWSFLWLVIVFGGLSFGTTATSVQNHFSNKILIETNDQLVAIHEATAIAINKQISGIDVTNMSLINGDTPYAAIIQAKVDIYNQIAQARVNKYEATVSIRKREIGMYWFVPKMLD